MRKIIHIDMDAFFSSIEQRDFPELKGKPVAVGGSGRRGVVAAASYEARAFGVYSAMPGFKAKQLCPDLIFRKHRFDAYKDASRSIRNIFSAYTDVVEPLSLDEAYLDVTVNKKNISSAITIARQIKERIKKELDLTASAGISFNKFLAKTASGMNKPDGLTFISESDASKILDELPINNFYGIGKVTAAKFKDMGTNTGKDLKTWSLEKLLNHFGKVGKYYYNIVRLKDNRSVEPTRETKSISAERTFEFDINDIQQCRQALSSMCDTVFSRMEKTRKFGKTVTLKIRTKDFKTFTRSKTISNGIDSGLLLQQTSFELLDLHFDQFKPLRLLGVGVSNLIGKNSQGQLKLNF